MHLQLTMKLQYKIGVLMHGVFKKIFIVFTYLCKFLIFNSSHFCKSKILNQMPFFSLRLLGFYLFKCTMAPLQASIRFKYKFFQC